MNPSAINIVADSFSIPFQLPQHLQENHRPDPRPVPEALLFDRDVKTIGKHINNALKEELEGLSAVANFATTASDGKTYQDESNRCGFVTHNS